MQEILKFIIGIGALILGFPIGILLARITKEELREIQIWVRLIILLSFVGAIVSLIVQNDVLLFTFLFFAIVTSMSLKKRNKKAK